MPAQLPHPLGDSWNAFGGNLSQELVCSTAKLMKELGLVEAGYRYLVMDDGWSDPERDERGRLQADRTRFPSGISAVAECVREQGLLLGIYGDSGRYTCQGFPGSYGHEREDAQTFAELGEPSLSNKYQTSSFSVRWEQLGYAPDTPATVRDLWTGEDLGVFNGSFSADVRLHDALAFRITPLHPLPSHSEWRPWLGQPMYERHEEDESWIPPLLRAAAEAD
ncbi:hypothetical protein COHA_000383 [Chlorella ohadii]|uniref:Alpha-galactosidase n=1 Tax=Chlorella ohadii TaxID=2649997 RepID=A0AAD5DX97_9CHLO|nr:hypothetical protein COHA_000383 [Chlorella ohadii]